MKGLASRVGVVGVAALSLTVPARTLRADSALDAQLARQVMSVLVKRCEAGAAGACQEANEAVTHLTDFVRISLDCDEGDQPSCETAAQVRALLQAFLSQSRGLPPGRAPSTGGGAAPGELPGLTCPQLALLARKYQSIGEDAARLAARGSTPAATASAVTAQQALGKASEYFAELSRRCP